MNHHSIHIFSPGHPNGNQKAWFWEVRTSGDVADCGHVGIKSGACDQAYEAAGIALGKIATAEAQAEVSSHV